MFDVTTLGEGQLRLTVPSGERLRSTDELHVDAAGSEANVAALLSQLGHRAAWATVLPLGELGDRVLDEYRSTGVDISLVRRVERGRVALYFLEPGSAAVPAHVVYDREYSSFRAMSISDFDWDNLLDTQCLFISGITPALSENTRAVVEYAVSEAQKRGVKVAIDINYRSTLWSATNAREVLGALVPGIWALFCSTRDAHTVFGIEGDSGTIASTLRDTFSVSHVITTDGQAPVTYAGAGGVLQHEVTPVVVVDRPGAGDALVAGVLHGLVVDDPALGLRSGVRAAALALSHRGDVTRITLSDLHDVGGTDIIR